MGGSEVKRGSFLQRKGGQKDARIASGTVAASVLLQEDIPSNISLPRESPQSLSHTNTPPEPNQIFHAHIHTAEEEVTE